MGYEAIAVVAILLAVFLWGPNKLPELARSIGTAKKEFERVAKETSTITASIATPTQTPIEDPIIVAAKSLSISTEGKTKLEIAQAIAAAAAGKSQ